ncbi:hypothetical protein CROQUDRAFT_653751 [Cronartium quercuum f. sp. fusiforme G11]|uniref:Uncharacterized protein n=1 Tax=Cronartium quercuum f. sp. fusiforme G11 TaxID=708437 RepID=A0A9P6TF14_9BASI|nr:hypothetical protein CROQUDRAFT_653751 [Cronartium quercuum f. sp. fusiforme G11]
MTYHPNQTSEPQYYPVRPTNQSSSSPSNRFREEHEMNSTSRNAPQPPATRPRIQTAHAFGAESDDESESDEDEGQGFNVYKDNPGSSRRYTNATNLNTEVYRDDPFTPPARGQHNNFPSSPSTLVNRPSPSDPSELANKKPVQINKADMVHMPALGSDWARDEAREDKDWEGKPGVIEKSKWANRKKALASKQGTIGNSVQHWFSGKTKACGWFGRIHGLALLIFLLIGLALMLFFLLPRAPTLAYNNQTLFVGDNSTASFRRADPIGFSFDAKINLAFDGRNSYVGPKVHDLLVIVQDLGSSAIEVGRGTLDGGSLKLSTKDYTPFSATVHFTHSASAVTDPIWASYYAACAHMWPGNSTRPTLNLALGVSYSVSGLSGQQFESTTLNAIGCPVELSANAS